MPEPETEYIFPFEIPSVLMVIEKDIPTYIPHRPPIIMVDKLLKADKIYALAGLRIKEDNILFMDGKFSEAGVNRKYSTISGTWIWV